MNKELYIVLDDVRSAYNVGSILRTADGAGVTKVFLCGYTPAPVDRFGRTVKEIEKTSLGASQTVPWERVVDIGELVAQFKARGIQVVVVEQSPRSVDYRTAALSSDVAFIFGNEREGVRKDIVELADTVVDIKMQGDKESLNVGVAVGVVLFSVLPRL